jgi:cysteine sulfinate desulfinase/cysteine desulfurase-like protein
MTLCHAEKKGLCKKIHKGKEAIIELLGAKKTVNLAFIPSMEEVYLKVVYEVLMPRAQRTGRNEILVPKREKRSLLKVLKRASSLGLTSKEVEMDELSKAISKRTLGLMMSFSEPFSGKIHPMFHIATLCKEEGLFLFVDATESVGKLFFRFQESGIDLFAFSHKNMTCVAGDLPQMKGDIWGEVFDLDEFFALETWAQEQLEMMDSNPMEYALIKNEAIEKVKRGPLKCHFYNEGGNFLYDRWCFSFEGVHNETLAYLLREKGIYLELFLGEHPLLSLKFDLQMSKTNLFNQWDTILHTALEIKEFSND